MAARIANVSRGGLFLRSDSPPAVGACVELSLELPDGLRIDLRGTVRHMVSAERAAAENRAAGAGIEFDADASTNLELLERLADEELGIKSRQIVGKLALTSVPADHAVLAEIDTEYGIHRRKS